MNVGAADEAGDDRAPGAVCEVPAGDRRDERPVDALRVGLSEETLERGMERYDASLAALANEAQLRVWQLDVRPGQAGGFAQAQAGESKQEEDQLFTLVADRCMDRLQ